MSVSEDPYNSSDDEIVSEPDQYAHLGQKLAAKLVENSKRDRKISKAIVKNLRPNFGVIPTNREYARWYNRFLAYRKASDTKMKFVYSQEKVFWKTRLTVIRIDLPPSMETIERFLVAMANNAVEEAISSRRESGIPSYGWLERGLTAVVVNIRFRHVDWQPAVNSQLRFRSLLNTLLDQGKLTRDTIRIKQWITIKLLVQLASGYISEALSSRPKSWSVVIMRTLSWVLQSAVDGRAGDITRSKGYESTSHFLKWKDIAFQFDDPLDFQTLKIRVWLENGKDNKGQPEKAYSKLVEPLANSDLNIADASLYLLIHGLRNGIFVGNTITELMQLARVNGGRIHVAQACMERPVICSIHNSGSTLLFDRAVSTEQINHSLQLAADSCGLLAPIASHDIKRGFVRDYTFGPVIPGVARPDVAYMARHSESSRLAGVTQGYVGPDNVAGFKSRAVNQYEDVHGVGGEFGNKFARIPYQKRKLRPEEIDDEIKDGEDVHDKKARQRASTRIHKRLRVEFSGEQGMNSQSHRAKSKIERKVFSTLPDASNILSSLFDTAQTQNIMDTIETQDAAKTPVALETISDCILGISVSPQIEDACVPYAELESLDVPGNPLDFIAFFVSLQGLTEAGRVHKEHPEGSGIYCWFNQCPNHVRGCNANMVSPSKIRKHLLSCKFKAVEEHDKEDEEGEDEEECEEEDDEEEIFVRRR